MRLPVRYFDSTQSGVLISRIMTDAEGIRNLVGTGLVQLTGGLVTAVVALGVLFYLNWRLTSVTLAHPRGVRRRDGDGVHASCGRSSASAARSTPRSRAGSGESLGGIRVVKTYTAEKREELVFTRGAHRLFRNIAPHASPASRRSRRSRRVIIGAIGVLMIVVGGHAILAGAMTIGDLFMYIVVHRARDAARDPDGVHRHADQRGVRGARPHPRDHADGDRGRGRRRPRGRCADVRRRHRVRGRRFEYNAGRPGAQGRHASTRRPARPRRSSGSSGSGKSTLISLVMAFSRPQRGADPGRRPRPRRACGCSDYRSHLGVVLQDNFLFDGTIAENIALLASPARRRDEIRAVAARRALRRVHRRVRARATTRSSASAA